MAGLGYDKRKQIIRVILQRRGTKEQQDAVS